VKTREARKLKREGLRRAKFQGHTPALISESGALHLFGCLEHRCNAILEAWDNPAILCGTMIHTGCNERLKRSWWLRLRRKVYLLIREGR